VRDGGAATGGLGYGLDFASQLRSRSPAAEEWISHIQESSTYLANLNYSALISMFLPASHLFQALINGLFNPGLL